LPNDFTPVNETGVGVAEAAATYLHRLTDIDVAIIEKPSRGGLRNFALRQLPVPFRTIDDGLMRGEI
jgi:hypothetical protein